LGVGLAALSTMGALPNSRRLALIRSKQCRMRLGFDSMRKA
jgi:hypothetical protein